MPIIAPVALADCGKLEGKNITPLYGAITAVCPGQSGESLWEKIRETHHLGFVDCESWVENMSAAIHIWNKNLPNDCASIKAVFGV